MMRGYSLSLLLACSAASAAPRLPAVVWQLDEDRYRPTPVAADGLSRDYFPVGESPNDWTERFSIRALGRGSDDPDQRFEAQAQAQRADCPEFHGERVRKGDEALPVWMSNCPEDAGGHGWSRFTKIILIGDEAYLASAERRGAPFARGKVADIGRDDVNRYIDFLASFLPCAELTTPGCIPFAALAGKYGDAPLTADEARDVAEIERRGLALYRQDQLAWHATDYVVEHHVFDVASGGGFLSMTGEGRTGSTYFFAKPSSADDVRVLARIDTDADAEMRVAPTPSPLPDDVLRRWRARGTALQSDALQLCAKTGNTIVLPDADGSWWVYVMSAVTDDRAILLGGHNRVHVDAEGRRILSIEHSANTCLAVNPEELRALRSNGTAFFTHYVSPLPWETDVMQSLTYAFALTRVTSSGVWRIEGDHVHRFALEPAAADATTGAPP